MIFFYFLLRGYKYFIYHFFEVKIISKNRNYYFKKIYLWNVIKNTFKYIFVKRINYDLPVDMIISNSKGRFKIEKKTNTLFSIESMLNNFSFELESVSESIDERFPIAIDVGANIGFYSLVFSTKFEKVYAIEPVPHTYNLLCENVKLNNSMKSIVPINLGISKDNDALKFYTSKEQNPISSITPPPPPDTHIQK